MVFLLALYYTLYYIISIQGARPMTEKQTNDLKNLIENNSEVLAIEIIENVLECMGGELDEGDLSVGEIKRLRTRMVILERAQRLLHQYKEVLDIDLEHVLRLADECKEVSNG